MLVALISMSGSPGVSTTALGITLTAPIPHTLLVEADPAGYSPTLAGYWQGTVRHDHSLINLVKANREDRLAQSLTGQVMQIRNQPGDSASVLPGLMNAAQGESMRQVWDPLGQTLSAMVRDNTHLAVLIDAGRFAPGSAQLNLLRHCDVIGIMARPTLTSALAVKSGLVPLRRHLHAARANTSLGLIMTGATPNSGGSYPAREFAAAVGLDIITDIPYAPRHAAIFSANARMPRWSIRRSMYLRSVENTWGHLRRHYEHGQPDWVAAERLTTTGDTHA